MTPRFAARAPLSWPARAARWTLALAALMGGISAALAGEHDEVDALIQARKFDEALARADRFLATKPRDVQMRFLKGVVQLETNRRVEAIATFTQLTQDAPELPEPYNNLAVLHASQGQYDRARVALEAALRTNPSYATAQENLGDVYARLAADAYGKALQMDPGQTAAAPKLAAIRTLLPAGGGTASHAAAPVAVAAAPAPAAPPRPPVPVPAPAPAPAPVPAPAPAPVAAPAPKPVPAKEAAAPARTAEVEQAVRAWAAAWAAQDMKRYLGAYADGFVPPGGASRSAWEEERRVRIVGKSEITVGIDQLQVEADGDKAVARFRQSYRAGTLNVRSRKTLDFVRQGGDWRITREAVGGR